MSRIGKQIIQIPHGTEVSISNGVFRAKGPKGELVKEFKDDVAVTIENNTVTFAPKNSTPFSRAIWGTYSSLVKIMIKGVYEAYSKKLVLEGLGFKSESDGKVLKLALGFSHPVLVPITEGLTVTAEKNIITVTGIDKEMVGQFTADVRAMKKPEPYKGKGFRYEGEVIRRKQGKKSA